ncbi:MAG: hypothetical protein O9342_00235 [Beijerinckiaceae bacterium]|nr:hypothetical protein [Beijerinckiaceae bacterium]
MTIGNMRDLGVRDLEAYCTALGCHHAGDVSGERFADDVPVPSIARRLVCSRCGARSAQVRPNWRQMQAPGMAHRP